MDAAPVFTGLPGMVVPSVMFSLTVFIFNEYLPERLLLHVRVYVSLQRLTILLSWYKDAFARVSSTAVTL